MAELGAGFEALADEASFMADFDASQVASKYGHASDFGVTGNYNQANANAFVDAMSSHMDNSMSISGTYRSTIGVTHFFDPTTNLNVMIDANGNFVSGWRLSPTQVINLMSSGNVQ